MEDEEQHSKLLIPLNEGVDEDYLRRLRNPWSLRGFFYRIIQRRRTARIKKMLKNLGAHQGKSPNFDRKITLEPPWITMPGYSMSNMVWRMGGGENFSLIFQRRYRSLSESSKENFRRKYPEPEGWKGYYSLILRGNDEHSRDSNITLEDLPSIGDRNEILMFARKFNGYEYYGSFIACAEAAEQKNRASLEDLQNELFFSYRAGAHKGDDTIIHAYAELLPFFKKLLS